MNSGGNEELSVPLTSNTCNGPAPATVDDVCLQQFDESSYASAVEDPESLEEPETQAYSALVVDEPEAPKSSLMGAAFIVSNAALGAGVLLFPNLFMRLGLVCGLLSFATAIALMGYTLHILARAAQKSGRPSYQEAVSTLVSPQCGTAIGVTMGIYLFGCCASYFVVIGDMIGAVIGNNNGRFWVITLSAVMVAPLMCLKDISMLASTSSFGVFVNFFVAFIMMAESAVELSESGSKCEWFHDIRLTTFGTAFSTYVFGLQCHLVFIPVYHSMRRSTVKRMDYVIVIAYTLCTLMYATTGVLGYCAFGAATRTDFLADNLPNNVWTQTARIGLAIKSFVSYPLLHYPARLCFGHLIAGEDVSNQPVLYYALTFGFLTATWIVASLVRDIGDIIDLTSALLGVFQVFIWPGVLLLAMNSGEMKFKVLSGLFFVVGVTTTITGVSDALIKI
eukprot:GEMP01029700.1.p1 GENE.GEMP01029700.1~~GEMP01029700.1.p1  ORF type:complete len:450 (+),score=76.77 GEMP01029700.1:379-1728(+)